MEILAFTIGKIFFAGKTPKFCFSENIFRIYKLCPFYNINMRKIASKTRKTELKQDVCPFCSFKQALPPIDFSTRPSLIMDCNRTTRCEIRYDQVSTIKPSKEKGKSCQITKECSEKEFDGNFDKPRKNPIISNKR